MPAVLDNGRLYVFVFGPGYGESIAVRVPPQDWLVIDSCRIAKQSAAMHLLDRYGGNLALLLLTHRHKDHYRGFGDLLGKGKWERIGCNDWRVADAAPVDAADPEDELRGELADVFSKILNQWETRPGSRLLTHRGANCPIGEGTLRILHPDAAFARAHRGGEPNNLSAAAVLEWNGINLLFGADVENPHWQEIAKHRANLGTHAFLKVPHHASLEAQHNCFLEGTPGRVWLVTPYNLNKGLPRFDDGEGMEILLGHEAAIHLTALPVRHSQQHDAPCETTRQDLFSGKHPRPIEFRLPGNITGVEQPIEPDVLSCYVGVSLIPRGKPEFFHGPGSLQIRDANSTTR